MPLYADLFTSVDPAFYGLRFHRLWERTAAGRPELHLPPGPAVLAVSVTHLQGLYVDPDQWPLLSRLNAAGAAGGAARDDRAVRLAAGGGRRVTARSVAIVAARRRGGGTAGSGRCPAWPW